ncbi:hypothetical protein GYMLUDRAFT_175753 [Collybiopsis luxurians FD-317 M1]|uniref:Glycoside hydrolase family 105 protein n=1 Tax=Collybiopsis luxurians FD-317 M1 TaxID=944289 RepID=A0A0D0BZF9_9AGAR|nr:hypothetical protein GYMLUDRAFT_175753 [Collybiopsis luxurians FD-317 M1]
MRTFPTFVLLWVLGLVSAQTNLTDSQVSDVVARLAQGATHPWELGTRAQAILEHDVRPFSVFSLSLPATSVPSDSSSAIAPVFSIASGVVKNRTSSNNHTTGPQPLVNDSSAADPASIGPAVLLANWTGLGNSDGVDYAGAAKDQLDYLYSDNVPKSSDGAISHRVGELQLWSDFVYMVPPFLAYYGLLTNNQTLLQDAYNQIKLYRDVLRDTNANNLWKHIELGSGKQVANDDGHWSTGNAWAAAGMLRVLASIHSSPFSSSMSSQQDDLSNWVFEIQSAMYPHLDSDSSLFHNYADDTSTFLDAASTALLASTVYRLSLLRSVHHFLPTAEKTRNALFASNSSGLEHFTSQGWLTPVVNPDSFGAEGTESPEGEAFVLDLQAAWTDWVKDGSKGANGAMRIGGRPNGPLVLSLVLGVGAMMAMVVF